MVIYNNFLFMSGWFMSSWFMLSWFMSSWFMSSWFMLSRVCVGLLQMGKKRPQGARRREAYVYTSFEVTIANV
jgi:hypothetical protein